MKLKSIMLGRFLWVVDENAVFSYGGDETPLFFTLQTQQWMEMGQPESITIMVAPA